jgi:hypothetical protein
MKKGWSMVKMLIIEKIWEDHSRCLDMSFEFESIIRVGNQLNKLKINLKFYLIINSLNLDYEINELDLILKSKLVKSNESNLNYIF